MNQGKRTGIKFQCGHHGLGSRCHRCEQADRLEADARDGILVTYEPSKAKKVPGVPREKAQRKASKPQIDAMLREVARLRSRPGQRVAPIAAVEAPVVAPVMVVARPKPTVEALQEKFSSYGAVSAKTLKAKQKGKKA